MINLIEFLRLSQQFFICVVLPSWVLQVLNKQECHAQEHNAMPSLRLESTIPQSRVKHSTTEPLQSLNLKLSDIVFFLLINSWHLTFKSRINSMLC